MVKRLIAALCLLMLAHPSLAGPFTVGQQTIAYSYPHVLGDGSNSRGGEAPAYAYQPADVATNSTLVTTWTQGLFGEFSAPDGSHPEAKARFDCNVTFDAQDDPIVNPGVQNGASHRHTFFGNTGTGNVAYNVTYATLRASGYSTCYGGPLNRTLYWEPSLYGVKNGVTVTYKPRNISTYYTAGGNNPNDGAVMSIWPRSLEFIGGFDMSDPTNHRGEDPIAAVDPTKNVYYGINQRATASVNGFNGWSCSAPESTDWRTPYSVAGSGPTSPQPYLADASGHPMLNCTATNIPGYGTGIKVMAVISSPNCWDGVNFTSPHGREHMMYGVYDQRVSLPRPGGTMVCPDHWYRVVVFEAHVEFAFKDQAEMAAAWLSSDRMPGMTQFNNGQSMHFDLIPAWDYGTGDHPGVFIKFFVHCDGGSAHIKNSDGVTYTDFVGDPHTCGFGAIDATENMYVENQAPPDGGGPNPVVNLNPPQQGVLRFFPLPTGTPLPGTVMHTHP